MPEVTAIKPVPASVEAVDAKLKPLTAEVRYIDDQLPQLHKGVAGSLKQAGIPVSDLTLNPAPHLPDFSDKGVVNKKILDASDSEPQSYRKIEIPGVPDIVRQHLTGDTAVTGESGDLHGEKQRMNNDKVTFLNRGYEKKPFNPFDWFYDKKKKAA